MDKNRRTSLLFSSVLALVLIAGGVTLYLLHHRPPEIDPAMEAVFAAAPTVRSYAMHTETSTRVSGRNLRVIGTHYLNLPTARFASYATTTLVIPPEQPESGEYEFSLDNVSIGNDIFTRITTESAFLKKTIPHSTAWRHFTANAIPRQFKDIAVHGPVLDQMLLFSEQGAYLELVEIHGDDVWEDAPVRRYTFKKAGSHPAGIGGTLETALSRIGEDGTVDVWIDPKTSWVRQLYIANPPYHSTTTFFAINGIPDILAPIATSSSTRE